MPVYFVTGRLGAGKSLVAVARIKQALAKQKVVATNMDINLGLMTKNTKSILLRVPDKPTADDLNDIGKGYEGEKYDESKFGLLVLDELGTWLNSRNWNSDKKRMEFIQWCIHARKLRWDIMFLVQDVSMVDAQVRNALCEYLVICRRTDRINIPGTPIKAPKVHIGKVYYGDIENDKLLIEKWIYRNKNLYKMYDTAQAFDPFYKNTTHCVLHDDYFPKPKPKPKTKTQIKREARRKQKQMKDTIMMGAFCLVAVFTIYKTGQRFFGDDDEHVANLQDNKTNSIPGTQNQTTTEATIIQLLKNYSYNGFIKTGNAIRYLFTDGKGNNIQLSEKHITELSTYTVYEKTAQQLTISNPDNAVIVISNNSNRDQSTHKSHFGKTKTPW